MKTTTETGSVSSGTVRIEDLIPTFIEEARKHATTDAERAELDEMEAERTENGFSFISFDDHENLARLFDLLNDAAPPGHYFGAHPGDGADFGFWAFEDDGELKPPPEA